MQITISLIDKASELCGSDSKLARELGVSPQLVSHWRKGRQLPSPLLIGKIGEIVGLSLDQALLARDFEELSGCEEGRALLERYKARFLALSLALGVTFGANATPIEPQVHQPVVDTLYIVSSRVRRLVSRLLNRRLSRRDATGWARVYLARIRGA